MTASWRSVGDGELLAALESAHLPTLLPAVAALTGDLAVLQAVLLPERPNLLAPQNGIFAVEPKVYALTGSFEWSAFLQAEQHIELPGPFPTGGSATSTTTVCALHDLGAAALVDVETEARNEADGALLF